MANKIIIKTNPEGQRALLELGRLANMAGNGDLQHSQQILTILQFIEVDPNLNKAADKKEDKKAAENNK